MSNSQYFIFMQVATNLALYSSIKPLERYFLLKIHLQPIVLAPGGKSTKIQVLFCSIESISVLIASFQNKESEEETASEKFKGSFSTRYV